MTRRSPICAAPLSWALNLVKNCVDEPPEKWESIGYPPEGKAAAAFRNVAEMLQAAARDSRQTMERR